MIGEVAIATVITNLIHQHKVDQWVRLLLSIWASATVTFLTTLSAGGLTHLNTGMRPSLAFTFGVLEACGATAGIIWFRWTHDPLTKGMAISAPASAVSDQNKILTDQSIVTDPNKKG